MDKEINKGSCTECGEQTQPIMRCGCPQRNADGSWKSDKETMEDIDSIFLCEHCISMTKTFSQVNDMKPKRQVKLSRVEEAILLIADYMEVYEHDQYKIRAMVLEKLGYEELPKKSKK